MTVLVLGGDRSEVGGAVADAGCRATFMPIPLPNGGGGQFDACLVDPTVEPDSDVGALLNRIHDRLKPDGFVGLVADSRRDRSSSRVLSVETLSALLFREGYTDPALRSAGAGRLAVAARRSRLARPAERMLKLSVVMPVFNEFGTFREIVTAVLAKTIVG